MSACSKKRACVPSQTGYNLDVAPGLEALEKMRNVYTEKGIDILIDAVSIPGVNLHYLLRGAVERGAELYSPGKEAYEMLKEAVVRGLSLVFTRYHEVDVTRIRSHRTSEPRRALQRPSGGGTHSNAQVQRRKLVWTRRSRYRDSGALASKV